MDPIPPFPQGGKKIYVVFEGTKLGVFYSISNPAHPHMLIYIRAIVSIFSKDVGGYCVKANTFEGAKKLWHGSKYPKILL